MEPGSRLDIFLDRLAVALREQLDPESGLIDPECQGPTPTDHYGQLSAALALRLHAGSQRLSYRTPLTVWQALPDPAIGHAPFNRFLLILLSTVCDEDSAGDPGRGRDRALLRLAAARCPLKRRYPSNNWTLLAELCRLLEATPGERQAPNRRLQGLFDRWMTPSGGFIDFPARSRDLSGVATPVAYHHKALFVAAVAAEYSGDAAWRPRLQRLLDWILRAHDGRGWVGGFGRSTHALFGDACLIAALVLLGAAGPRSEGENPLSDLLGSVLTRLERQRRMQDGLYWLTPSCAPGAAGGWDNYMYLSVYNAWFAAVTAWARHRRRRYPAGNRLMSVSQVAPEDGVPADAGATGAAVSDVQRARSASGLSLWFGVRGQPPQAFSRNEVDFRYGGGVPFHGRLGRWVVIPAAVRVQVADLIDHPALAGWTPVFRVAGRLYGLTDFDAFSVSSDEAGIEYRLKGCPRALLRRPADRLTARVVAAMDWRLGGGWGKREALRREHLGAVRGTLTLRLCPETPRLSVHWGIENGDTRPIDYLNPCGHALVASALPRNRRITLCAEETGEQTFELSALQRVAMPSATGEALGFCLPSQALAQGSSAYGIAVEWSRVPG